MKKIMFVFMAGLLLLDCNKSESVQNQSSNRFSEFISQQHPSPKELLWEYPNDNLLRAPFQIAFDDAINNQENINVANSAMSIITERTPSEVRKLGNSLYLEVPEWLRFDARLSEAITNGCLDQYKTILSEFKTVINSDATTWGRHALPNNSMSGLQKLRTTTGELEINASMLLSVHIQQGMGFDNLQARVRKYLYQYCMITEIYPDFIGAQKSAVLSYMNNRSIEDNSFYKYTDARDMATFLPMWITWRRGRIISDIAAPWWNGYESL